MTISVDQATVRALWLDRLDPDPALHLRPSLAQLKADPATANDVAKIDVVIVGGGFSGLWTAYYLAKLDPSRKIMVVEREFCGFGASGRNGGWCIGELAGSIESYAARSTLAEARRLARAAFDAVDEVGRVSEAEGIDCDYAKGGAIRVARNQPQADRQQAEIAHHRELGFTEDEIRLLDATEAREYLNATDVLSGIHFSPCAAIDPAKLARGLAATVERMGVTVVEQTAVTDIGDGRVDTVAGPIHAPTIIRATEAYTRDLPGRRRDLVPVYSLMVATEPLDEAVFDEIGLADRPTFADDRYMVIYGQRTADSRLAFGGRGVPYIFGSGINPESENQLESHRLLGETLVELFPVLDGITITHRWGGVLAIPRNWLPGLRFDPISGQGTLGGYIGEGVAAANLAGRTMAELVAGHDTERTSLPWVGVESRPWEPEPLRWIGVRASRRVLREADKREYATNREAKVATTLARILREGLNR